LCPETLLPMMWAHLGSKKINKRGLSPFHEEQI
jgi:hypothetical protein